MGGVMCRKDDLIDKFVADELTIDELKELDYVLTDSLPSDATRRLASLLILARVKGKLENYKIGSNKKVYR
jgi:hypothetical protein